MRGRVSDPFQPLRAAHIPNAPGFAGGWLPELNPASQRSVIGEGVLRIAEGKAFG